VCAECQTRKREREREGGREEEKQALRAYVEKKREMSRPRKVDVSGAIDVARHPRVATLELLLGRQSPFRTSPSRAEKPLFTLSLSRCLTPTKVSMSQLLQFSRLSTDVRNETKTDNPQVVSINECIHVARE